MNSSPEEAKNSLSSVSKCIVIDQKKTKPRVERGYQSTEETYKRDVRAYQGFLARTGAAWGWESLQDWVEELGELGKSGATIRRYFSAVKHTMLTEAESSATVTLSEKLELSYHLAQIKVPKTMLKNRWADVPTIEEVRTVLRRCSSAPRTKLLIECLLTTACRVRELCRMRVDDCKRVSPEYYKVRVRGKGNKERMVEIPVSLFARVRKEFKGETWLFTTEKGDQYNPKIVASMISKLFQLYAMRKVSPHLLRHLWVTQKLAEGVSIEAVSQYVGHKDISTTVAYYAHNAMKPGTAGISLWKRK